MTTRVAEQHQSIVILAVSPTIWAAHFLLCYVTGAIWCAKQATALAPLGGVRVAVAIYTILALLAIAAVGWIGYRAHRMGDENPPHDEDTPEDRHRFIGFATLLLSGMSALAVVYAALVVVFVNTCQ
jgi:hypothetical protein